ncbi:LysR family transcriptional regulator (plasmid) [Ralstonia syzygii subsp. celebesensis]|uniref:LysR family transcriptional regulator n=2 Tax=Ralstonia syzygii subsp. celebesensis TaxID=1310168 RepID=A0A1U9VNF8_9RALS|nr:LysR family transcriptional regulator [Ralstonia syzygii]AQW31727.1 LysR family transcriptional regulator [blood disease bacterium A2-HR MARDI]QQV54840.1 LysR family transcriptional regulator [Ralstonia syzygii subsp. celebesensis]QQV57140.1 LysR family transcriptional regulator [Ralstonia syzygii subsp. celebesensis]CCA82171.1 putative transcriptional regulator, LysR family [blood disease bacterium R229]
MTKENLNDLQAFVAVARERSFTRAAAQLGVSRSALSHAMLGLEARLGVRLLTRTTRSVSTTEAGARLLNTLAPRLDEIETELASLSSLRDKPAGTVRITAHDHAITTVLWPRLRTLLHAYPDINVELSVDYAFTDIAAARLDAGVRSGDRVDKDMIAVRIGPDMRMAVAGSPDYFATHDTPATPRDLTEHRCINLRLPTHGGLYAWEFEKNGEALNVRVDGQTIFNNTFLMLQAALDGMGLAYVPLDLLEPHIAAGRLVPVLHDWWPQFPGYHLYYASRRQVSPALALVIEALRYSEPDARTRRRKAV